ncbi:aldehyde dehydrogenase family protein [Babesia caballi]|uniref:Aldehyde dehydrogenase family protein n=1 Tax=Babesia caballi TaxID=5871 RepID=A0AAV4LX08_BABCB|nr:aldehyde dehydrogenase family protein [Babesia caballi]
MGRKIGRLPWKSFLLRPADAGMCSACPTGRAPVQQRLRAPAGRQLPQNAGHGEQGGANQLLHVAAGVQQLGAAATLAVVDAAQTDVGDVELEVVHQLVQLVGVDGRRRDAQVLALNEVVEELGEQPEGVGRGLHDGAAHHDGSAEHEDALGLQRKHLARVGDVDHLEEVLNNAGLDGLQDLHEAGRVLLHVQRGRQEGHGGNHLGDAVAHLHVVDEGEEDSDDGGEELAVKGDRQVAHDAVEELERHQRELPVSQAEVEDAQDALDAGSNLLLKHDVPLKVADEQLGGAVRIGGRRAPAVDGDEVGEELDVGGRGLLGRAEQNVENLERVRHEGVHLLLNDDGEGRDEALLDAGQHLDGARPQVDAQEHGEALEEVVVVDGVDGVVRGRLDELDDDVQHHEAALAHVLAEEEEDAHDAAHVKLVGGLRAHQLQQALEGLEERLLDLALVLAREGEKAVQGLRGEVPHGVVAVLQEGGDRRDHRGELGGRQLLPEGEEELQNGHDNEDVLLAALEALRFAEQVAPQVLGEVELLELVVVGRGDVLRELVEDVLDHLPVGVDELLQKVDGGEAAAVPRAGVELALHELEGAVLDEEEVALAEADVGEHDGLDHVREELGVGEGVGARAVGAPGRLEDVQEHPFAQREDDLELAQRPILVEAGLVLLHELPEDAEGVGLAAEVADVDRGVVQSRAAAQLQRRPLAVGPDFGQRCPGGRPEPRLLVEAAVVEVNERVALVVLGLADAAGLVDRVHAHGLLGKEERGGLEELSEVQVAERDALEHLAHCIHSEQQVAVKLAVRSA